LIKIGIGGIAGAGKSTVCDFFKADGAYVINLDAVAHELYSSDKSATHKQIVKTFSQRVPGLTGQSGLINRKALGSFVFKNRAALDELNAIFYNQFNEYIKDKISILAQSADPPQFFVLDAAVLFDSGLYKIMDRNIWVTARKDLLIERLMKLRNVDERYAKNMIETQVSSFEKQENKADFIIENDFSLDKLRLLYHNITKEISINVKNI